MTNLGKYNEGQLAYERLQLPTDAETVQAALQKIGIDGIRYEEIFIADYDGSEYVLCPSSMSIWASMRASTS